MRSVVVDERRRRGMGKSARGASSSGGSKVRKASRAKSRRRREGTGFKFDFDYGPYFGDGVGRGGVVKTESEKDVAGMFFTRASRG